MALAGNASGFDSVSKGKGMDPVTLSLAAASALGSLFGGGDDSQQKRKSFQNTSADPILSLTDSLDTIKRLGMALGAAPPRKIGGYGLRTPSPVSIPGVPFQIGGGMGSDPNINNPVMADPFAMAAELFKPVKSQGQAGQPGQPGRGPFRGGGDAFNRLAQQTIPLQDQEKRL